MLDLSTLLIVPLLADSDGPGWWVVFFPLGWLIVIAILFLLFRLLVLRRGRWRQGGAADPPDGDPGAI
jgi:hypothetical protein